MISGLSPRVRGNLEALAVRAHRLGSIPACAGEPRRSRRRRAACQVYPRVCGGTDQPLFPAPSFEGLSPRVRGNPVSALAKDGQPGSIPACAGEPGGAEGRRAALRVYPRVCGGTGWSRGTQGSIAGLSPRVRGNPGVPGLPRRSERSIPACAGEPSSLSCGRRKIWVYPRVCGGTASLNAVRDMATGLSPRVRGNLRYPVRPPHAGGSIPACAGEPSPATAPRPCGPVYPRVCGGTRAMGEDRVEVEGLSPRVRGNHALALLAPSVEGSIPACAGEPRRPWTMPRWRRVYPRVCGGTSVMAAVARSTEGLSPRVRGNLSSFLIASIVIGSIPACAGEPPSCSPGRRTARVYPRVCGGTVSAVQAGLRAAGLSPRVRGNPSISAWSSRMSGSIPACAGEPATPMPMTSPLAVYPRVCGGTAKASITARPASGLSPRVRGNPGHGARSAARLGSIPACAGEPSSRP